MASSMDSASRRAVVRGGRTIRMLTGLLGLLVALVFMNASAALAWSQLKNDFDTGGSGYCGGSSTYPCLFWQEANYTSTTVYSYFDPSIDQGYQYSFTTATNRAFSDFNAAPAYNPYTYQCSTIGCENNIYAGADWGGCGAWAGTSFNSLGSIQYNGAVGYYQFIRSAYVYYNIDTNIAWNNNLTYMYDGSRCVQAADGRKVATHETGHVFSLGHTAYTAVMHQGPEPFYSLQSNDIAGLQAIYTGTSPAS